MIRHVRVSSGHIFIYVFGMCLYICVCIFTLANTLIERNPPPRGGFLFTMFPHQEPCVRGPPSKDLYQGLRGGSSYTRFLMREHNKQEPPPGGGVSFDLCVCTYVYTYSHQDTRVRTQGGDDAQDALICRSLSAKEPLIIGLFCRKRVYFDTRVRTYVYVPCGENAQNAFFQKKAFFQKSISFSASCRSFSAKEPLIQMARDICVYVFKLQIIFRTRATTYKWIKIHVHMYVCVRDIWVCVLQCICIHVYASYICMIRSVAHLYVCGFVEHLDTCVCLVHVDTYVGVMCIWIHLYDWCTWALLYLQCIGIHVYDQYICMMSSVVHLDTCVFEEHLDTCVFEEHLDTCGGLLHVDTSVQGGEDSQDPSSLQVISCKNDLYLVALLWKRICNLGDPMSLRHPVCVVQADTFV